MSSSFQLIGIDHSQFQTLFDFSDAQLAQVRAKRCFAEESPGYPCRISLEDALVGEGVGADDVIIQYFSRAEVASLHLHNAKRGCFACKAIRAQRHAGA